MSLQETPSANRLHIAVYGRRNAGKSSLINCLTRQQTALVSDVAGTTTDPVQKAMEVRGLGACVWIDTAGFDDVGDLGSLRVQKTKETIAKAEIAVLVLTCSGMEEKTDSQDAWDLSMEMEWNQALKTAGVHRVAVINKADLGIPEAYIRFAEKKLGLSPVLFSAKTGEGREPLLEELGRQIPEQYGDRKILGNLVGPHDIVMLVMPQDAEAPKGRLILPQVQTIRELLDRMCVCISVTLETLDTALAALKNPPSLIVTDSQVFQEVYPKVPKGSRLTSFSVLFAAYKGDVRIFQKGAEALDRLTENSHILIAEACTHAPLSEDIGRVKIPAMLKKRFGETLQIDMVSGADFPEDVSGYDLIIHCGGCMFHRKYLLSRIEKAQEAQVPITNYGILIAKIKGILEHVELPEE